VTKYRCLFFGRKVGAIGMGSAQCVDLEAESPEDARIRCYDTHEHIQHFRAFEAAHNGNPDDGERIACTKAGTPGHRQCGLCPKHGTPRFDCGCIAGAP